MYIKDAIKEIDPIYTYEKCLKILHKYDLFNKGLINKIRTNYKIKQKLNCYVSNCSIDFSSIFGIENLVLEQNGKGLTYEQCMASMYMETFERLSAIVSSKNKILNNKKILDYKNNPIIYKMINNGIIIKKFFILIHNKKTILNDEYYKHVKFKNLIDNKYLDIPYIASAYNWTDGLNSGNTKDEAILGGIYEVIERYCIKAFFEDKKDIISNKININSVCDNIPELKKTLENMKDYDNIGDYYLIEIKLKGTQIYTYIFFCKTSGKYSNFGAGTHIIKRIGVIRAVSELIQVFFGGNFDHIDKSKINNAWGIGGVYISNFFSLNFIEKRIIDFPNEKEFIENDIDIISINNLLNITIQELKKINIKYILSTDITHKKIGIHSYIVKIPDLGLFWGMKYNIYFHEMKNKNGENIIFPYNIEGINKIFSLVYINNNINSDLIKHYYKLILSLYDYELERYITEKNHIVFNKKEFKKNDTIYSSYSFHHHKDKFKIERKDPESFIYFREKLNKKKKSIKDFLYLFEVYCKIGWIDYGVYYLNKEYKNYSKNIEFRNIYNKHFSLLHNLANNNGEKSNFNESNILFKKLNLANKYYNK